MDEGGGGLFLPFNGISGLVLERLKIPFGLSRISRTSGLGNCSNIDSHTQPRLEFWWGVSLVQELLCTWCRNLAAYYSTLI